MCLVAALGPSAARGPAVARVREAEVRVHEAAVREVEAYLSHARHQRVLVGWAATG